jgi:hypothetical protein
MVRELVSLLFVQQFSGGAYIKMEKNVIVFGILLLFLGLAFTPTINSSFVNVNSEGEEEQNEDEEYVEIEIYEFKGKFGIEKEKKKITFDNFESLQIDLNSIQERDFSLKNRIKNYIEIYKKYGLISEEHTYEKMEIMLKEQQSYMNSISNKADKEDESVYNLMSLYHMEAKDFSISGIGFPPFLFLYLKSFLGILFPFLLLIPDIWATATLKCDYLSIITFGLLGLKSDIPWGDNIIVTLLGVIGYGFIWFLPPESTLIFDSFGFTAFCSLEKP